MQCADKVGMVPRLVLNLRIDDVVPRWLVEAQHRSRPPNEFRYGCHLIRRLRAMVTSPRSSRSSLIWFCDDSVIAFCMLRDKSSIDSRTFDTCSIAMVLFSITMVVRVRMASAIDATACDAVAL